MTDKQKLIAQYTKIENRLVKLTAMIVFLDNTANIQDLARKSINKADLIEKLTMVLVISPHQTFLTESQAMIGAEIIAEMPLYSLTSSERQATIKLIDDLIVKKAEIEFLLKDSQ